MKGFVTATIIATMFLTASAFSNSDNLIANGDFELGDAEFTTEYIWVAPPGHLHPDGRYTVYTDPHAVHGAFASYGDHTSGTGNMLILNAASNVGTPHVHIIWQQAVAVTTNTDYVLTYWLSSCVGAAPANVECSINGTALGTQLAPSSTGQWIEVTYNWSSGSNTTATITLEDLTRAYSGDDFAIDDISFEALNNPPVAICQETIAGVGEVPDIDGGSYDPDGDAITLVVNPPYYTVPGIYYPTLTVTDEYGASDDCTAMVAVYDPSAGFVTGGGWIDSPEGAYAADPSLTGKANFGFVSKYKKGATVPTGTTEFQFKAGDLNFHSSSYDWLVVSGTDKAKFKGTGAINGIGPYKFMLWAGDEAWGGVDTFRIKIWEEAGGEVVIYDNGGGEEGQAIDGGSIVVHAK